MTQILHTKPLKEHLLAQVKKHVETLSNQGKKPTLCAFWVGNNTASKTYICHKEKTAHEAGMGFKLVHLPEEISEDQLLEQVQQMNDDAAVTGIIVQLPLPEHINHFAILNAISAEKDVDGLGHVNAGRTSTELANAICPATPVGIMRILKWANIELLGKEAVVIGRSQLVGQPVALMLAHANATVTICHKETVDLNSHLGRADIIISATGCPMLVEGKKIKTGSVIIDVGISPNADPLAVCKIVGDVCESVQGIAAAVTPVPGGVGPMTVVSLLTNVIDAAYLQHNENVPVWDIPTL